MKTTLHILSLAAISSVALLLSACAPTTTPSNTPAGNRADYQNSKAEVVVLNFFDMYCPKCQKDAKYVNALYNTVQHQKLGSKIQFYAIGWSNSPLEAEMYRKRYNVTYPVLSDKNRTISSRFGKFRPPLLIALKKQGGQWTEFYRTHGVRNKSGEILRNITP
jgi:peroxiredoxin